MSGVPLRSLPTGPGVPTEGPAEDVHLAAESLDSELEPALLRGATAVVVAASLLDFLR